MRGFMVTALLLGGAVGQAHAAPERGMQQQFSISYRRADLYTGLPPSISDWVDSVMDTRFAASSMRTVHSALVHWEATCARYGWETVIMSEDPERGGKMCAFVHHLTTDLTLVANSISNLVWGLRTWMKLQRQSDPLMGVENWHDFMLGARVLTHVPHEPRRAIPHDLLIKMLERVNRDVFWEVQWALFVCILYLTFSRSECPCPKNFTGEESWDDNKHWMVRDIVIRQVGARLQWALAVRFKAVKQDPRIERGQARGDGTDRRAHLEGGADWAYVGDAPGSILSVFMWYRRLMQFFSGPRDPTSPFFLARDMVRPYTYTAGMSDLKQMLQRVGTDLAYGLHGLRVEGFNRWRAANGEELAVAQGLWQPGSEARYIRFDTGEVLSGPSAVAGVANPYVSDRQRPQPRELQRVRPVGHRRAMDDMDVARPAAAPATGGGDGHGAAGAVFVLRPTVPAPVAAVVPAVRPGVADARLADALFGAATARAVVAEPMGAATPVAAPTTVSSTRASPSPPPLPPVERRHTRAHGTLPPPSS